MPEDRGHEILELERRTAEGARPEPAVEDVPHGYGADTVVLLVRDPSWIHSYWEITPQKYEQARADLKLEPHDPAFRVLRVYDVSGPEFDGRNANLFFDIRVDDTAQLVLPR